MKMKTGRTARKQGKRGASAPVGKCTWRHDNMAGAVVWESEPFADTFKSTKRSPGTRCWNRVDMAGNGLQKEREYVCNQIFLSRSGVVLQQSTSAALVCWWSQNGF